MKYIVIIGDGMSDRPLNELGGLTPLKKAHIPNMDRLVREGTAGRAKTIPEGFQPGSDVANLSILGYDPTIYYSGRAPLEAASMGIDLEKNDVAYRCNLVTLDFHNEDTVMNDYSGGHITTKEARSLIESIDDELGTDNIRFYPGVGYRHLMVWKNGSTAIDCTPPHDITGKAVSSFMPKGDGATILRKLMDESVDILSEHPLNKKRVKDGKKPANSIWFWGQGRKPSMPTYREKYNIGGSLISAVDLTKGLGVYAGFDIINVPGATGYIDTNYKGKAEYALASLKDHDLVYVHIEAPDEAGHNGNLNDKIRAIEDIDSLVVGPMLESLLKSGEPFRMLVMPDHSTPIEVRTHTKEMVPFVLYDSSTKNTSSGFNSYDEDIVSSDSALTFNEGFRLMDFLIK